MKKLLLLISAYVVFNGVAFGALPPLWQNVAEIKAILNDPKLGEFLSSADIIHEIKKSPQGWVIVTQREELSVEVVYQAASHPGPVPFTLIFRSPTPE